MKIWLYGRFKSYIIYREAQIIIRLELHVAWELCALLTDGTTKQIPAQSVHVVNEDQVLGTFETECVHAPKLDRVACDLNALVADKDLFH